MKMVGVATWLARAAVGAAVGGVGWIVGRKLVRGAMDFDDYAPGRRFAPKSTEAKALFRAAALKARLPEEWADEPGLHEILKKESDGKVGIPNYLYNKRIQALLDDHRKDGWKEPQAWAQIHDELKAGRYTSEKIASGPEAGKYSSAAGLGQLTLPNMRLYMPSGPNGLGVPIEEAVGMLRYIKARYGTPANAWALYGKNGEGY